MRSKVGDRNDIAIVRVNKDFVPRLKPILDLDDMGESQRAIRFDKVFQRARIVVILPTKGRLGNGDGLGKSLRWAG
jgi:hypothetical protein